MNTDTGQIHIIPEDRKAFASLFDKKLVPIEASMMTEAQLLNGHVDRNDTTSELGKLLHAERSKYRPHVGAKEAARPARKGAKSSGSTKRRTLTPMPANNDERTNQ